jgi:hypothetical protein
MNKYPNSEIRPKNFKCQYQPMIEPPYKEFDHLENLPLEFYLGDHFGGFDQNFNNTLLNKLQTYASLNNIKYKIHYHEILEKEVTARYPNLEIMFKVGFQDVYNLHPFYEYRQHPEIDYKNFICSFNGSPHVNRKLLVAILEKFKYFNPEYCSKNFSFTTDSLDGHITDYVTDRNNFYRKFFISTDSDIFFDTVSSFGLIQYAHNINIYHLEHKLTQSFLHIVSETLATSYVPFVTEKFMYSIITRGLFVAYAQPGWHAHVEQYYGFKKYDTIFNYQFDSIQNPIERLVELISMISKFSKLSAHDWHDLYQLEANTIEFNYDHYFSGNYLTKLAQYE